VGGKGVWEEPVGHQPPRKGIRRLMRKRRRVKRTPGSGTQKNRAVKRFQDQVLVVEGRTLGSGDKRMEQRKDSRIRWLIRKKEQNIKNETEKRFQDQAEVRQKDARIRGQKNGAEKDSRIRWLLR
jgi:hypothetical protein